MKIGKYPVKHRYRIARLVSDVFSLALGVLIVTATVNFLEQYSSMLELMGEDNVQVIVENSIPSLVWRQWLALIFPGLALADFVLYIVLTLKSHPMKKYHITKLTAQECCDVYTFCVSLCKIPVLLGIFDAMYIFHQNMLGAEESVFSLQIILDIILIAIISRMGMHRIEQITEKHEEKQDDDTIKLKAVVSNNENGQEEQK